MERRGKMEQKNLTEEAELEEVFEKMGRSGGQGEKEKIENQ